MKDKLNTSRVALILLALGAGFVLSACNTVEGVGKDIEATGDAISDTARDAKD
jgi:entericidin B